MTKLCTFECAMMMGSLIFEKVRDVLGSDAAFAGSKAAGKAAAAKSSVRSAKKAKKATDEVEDEDDGEDVQAAKTVSWMGKPKLASHLLSDVKGAYEADVPKDHRMYYEELELE